MINKVAGYQGFQSYGDLPYPSLKAGKSVLSPHDIWENTTRARDESSLYDNHAHHKTIYATKTSEVVAPKDYQHHQHVKKGLQSQNQFPTIGKALLSQTAGPNGFSNQKPFDPNDETSKLKTGVEHWKSTYNAGIKDPYAYSKASRPQWSFPKPAYEVDSKIGPTEYKTSYGEFGTKPTDKLNAFGAITVDKYGDALKMGTTQSTFHIPNYQGFIPAARTAGIALEQSSATESRKDKSRATIVDNYHTKIPGYAGHQPKALINQRGLLREFCFSTTSNIKI